MKISFSLIVPALCATSVFGTYLTSVERELSIVAGRIEESLPFRHDRDRDHHRPDSWSPRLICHAFRNATRFIRALDKKVDRLKDDCSSWESDRDHDMRKWHV